MNVGNNISANCFELGRLLEIDYPGTWTVFISNDQVFDGGHPTRGYSMSGGWFAFWPPRIKHYCENLDVLHD